MYECIVDNKYDLEWWKAMNKINDRGNQNCVSTSMGKYL